MKGGRRRRRADAVVLDPLPHVLDGCEHVGVRAMPDDLPLQVLEQDRRLLLDSLAALSVRAVSERRSLPVAYQP